MFMNAGGRCGVGLLLVASLAGFLTTGCSVSGSGDSTGGSASFSPLEQAAKLPESLAGIGAGLSSEEPAERAYAATELGKEGPAAGGASGVLIGYLEDPDWRVRSAAAEALGKIGDSGAVEPLIDVVSDRDEQWSVRTAAARSLGRLGDPRAVEPLVAVLNDMNAHVRHMAIVALGQIGTPETVEPLAVAARSESDAAGRFSAAEALSHLR